jgi:hypothetical protein
VAGQMVQDAKLYYGTLVHNILVQGDKMTEESAEYLELFDPTTNDRMDKAGEKFQKAIADANCLCKAQDELIQGLEKAGESRQAMVMKVTLSATSVIFAELINVVEEVIDCYALDVESVNKYYEAAGKELDKLIKKVKDMNKDVPN